MISKAKTLTIDYTPLKTSVSMDIVGSVAGRQTYNAYTKTFTPDYTLVPLTLFPRCIIADVDSVVASGSVNAQLTNMRWLERWGDYSNVLTSNSEYTIVESGEKKGQITVKINSSVIEPVTLEFEAEYVDPRTGQRYLFEATHKIIVTDETYAPVLSVDTPTTTIWNPLRDPVQQKFTAKLISSSTDLTAAAGTTFAWYHKIGDALVKITGDGDNDFDIVSVDKNVLTIDRDFIGDEQTFVCRAHHNTDGSSSEPTDKDEAVMMTVIRRIPKVECDWKGLTYGIPGGNRKVRVVGYIRDTVGDISNPDDIFRFEWWTKKAGESGFTRSSMGRETELDAADGMRIELRVEDKGPQALVVDDNDPNLYITDAAGTVLFQRINDINE